MGVAIEAAKQQAALASDAERGNHHGSNSPYEEDLDDEFGPPLKQRHFLDRESYD